MSLSLLLEMAATGNSDRPAVACAEIAWTVGELQALVQRGSGIVAESGARSVAYVGTGGHMLPLLLFAAAGAAVPFTPLNYRLSVEALGSLIDRLDNPLLVYDEEYRAVLDAGAPRSVPALSSTRFLAQAATAAPVTEFADPDEVAVVLFTSGTTAAPKAVELTHQNLTEYITGTVEFDSAAVGDTALVGVPPYHIAGVSAALSNLYAGRRIVYLRTFDAARWVELVGTEQVTSATVVPTMLSRIVTEVERAGTRLPSLRTLAYGGSKVPQPLLRTALKLLPDVGFVNAYGLTETSSTITVLGPDEHRAALAATDPAVADRLGSVGTPVPGIELQIRAADGTVLGPGESGELFVRGPQVSGRYTGIGSVLDPQGWFPTRDRAMLDAAGYLFLGGRADDTIIRGGENIAPAEIEDVLVEHSQVREVAVIGVDDAQWGQIIVAVVVPVAAASPDAEALRAFVRSNLRGSRTPDRVVFRTALPVTPTGKILRRELVAEYGGPPGKDDR
ncbi:class I adenylate-forming enzyme family protein [Skermania piniformis]|uniref:Long-chain fatty acid--CoA ligase n=1 Tax=Skermania pinensis TaxID=39122 RepID=A0ABX8SDJ3_9ACTN|nr:fatty acid--CoA ligase family protein [Skermania piniformis]QXQ15381.1 long-chain fatty acid--CoA ligase [Skermania piniformis]